MNVLYIGGFSLPDKNAAAHRVISNSKIISELGHNVILVGQDVGICERKKVETTIPNLIMFNEPYPNNMSSWFKYIFGVKKLKQLIIKNNIECLILYNYPTFSILRMLPFLRKRGIKVIADCTEWYGTPDGNVVKKIIKNLDTSLRMRYLNFKIDGVITISSFLTNYYRKTKTIEIPPLVDLFDEKYKSLDRTVDRDKINFIYAGQMGNKDKIIDALYSFSRQRDRGKHNFVFNVVGIEREDFVKMHNPSFSFDEFVKFYGRRTHKEVLDMVAHSDFVLFFRDNNRVNNAGFPTKFVEAMSCGTPVITNSTSNISDYLKDGENGFIIKEFSEIESTIEKAISMNKETIIDMKKKCLKESRFHYMEYKEMMREFLNEI